MNQPAHRNQRSQKEINKRRLRQYVIETMEANSISMTDEWVEEFVNDIWGLVHHVPPPGKPRE